ncbi:MAG: DUF3592 domain-containing protein [Gammaproteobacteria bacterium]|nr:DUF3592 domain-containing protein [Gammaproteobacteria bacterium]MBU1653714.1 DUF3592 domain-containing protein [Gammaproteobacteria bacterium]MBU1960882.1 DUF3592 domain-containing protein [Gammaproteobacteria bacterium]
MNPVTLIKYIFSLVGLTLLGGAYLWQQHTLSFLAGAALAEGTVIGFRVSGTSDSYHPRVRFTTNEGETIEFVSSSGSRPPAYDKGEGVEVLYRPSDPHLAMIKGFFSLWAGPLILGGIGGIFALIGILLMRFPPRFELDIPGRMGPAGGRPPGEIDEPLQPPAVERTPR